jgi:hypothetical protein
MPINEARCDQLSDEYYQMMFDFLSSFGFSECDGCIPLEVEKWNAIIQALADFSGYSVALRLASVEIVRGAEMEMNMTVGQQDVLNASPSCFVVTDKSICIRHFGAGDNRQKQ